MKNQTYKNRQFFQERIRKSMIGPGSDVIVRPEEIEEEVVSNYPLIRYFSGILFPDKKPPATQNESDEKELESASNSEDEIIPEEQTNSESLEEIEVIPETDSSLRNKAKETGQNYVSQNNFFPNNMGITFCVEPAIEKVKAIIEFGTYKVVTSGWRIAIAESVFSTFMEHPTFPFKHIIKYENGYLILTRKLKGEARSPRTEEYEILDDFKKSDDFKNSSLKAVFPKFESLMRRLWIRTPHKYEIEIPVENGINESVFHHPISKKQFLELRYRVKTYQHNNDNRRRYVKIQLVNTSSMHPANRFSNKNENLNKKCIFQTKIQIETDSLLPYKSYLELNPFDDEAQTLDYLYRDIKSYGIGHNCALEWDKTQHNKPRWVTSTFLPTHDVLDTKNSFKGEIFTDEEVFNIYDLSTFSNIGKTEIIRRISSFIEQYENWLKLETLKKQGGNFIMTEEEILSNISETLERLKTNLYLLSTNDKVYEVFKLANTAMFIQIVISITSAFGGNEKELTEIENNFSHIDYDSLDAFKNNETAQRKIEYRPFQLAFLLLNLEGIVKEKSISREEIVDLIWFPTGGGKTEAYLAVTAFTIIWRRLNFGAKGNGTSVIMRYTLRLLTAQQFERASRLVVALNFMRNKKVANLGKEPISIGLWVGMASTPNSVSKAKEIVGEILEEIHKAKNDGKPESKNKFQISACPWCGTKLITKNKKGLWLSGFRNVKNEFIISCNNTKCHYHESIPIQVIDELLYDSPPTILFATVDKFARLAWEEKGHSLFNSQNDNLPPSLIIQDELHLLSGPLGSITGLFESVVEICCTEDGHRPKIIASTATTRNTKEQVKALYGNRVVKIFPPTGLSSTDSFFAKTSIESKRRYLGFMPTGKTKIDTEMQLLAHLFYARLEAFLDTRKNIATDEDAFDILDKYWTLVSYYNSLRDVGRTHNKLGDEVSNFTSTLQIRMKGNNPNLNFNFMSLQYRVEELTSRIPSTEIKNVLKRLEELIFKKEKLKTPPGKDYKVLHGIIDLVLATNMISVGIDIDRLNVMLMNGQPRNVAEYIQASSRVGRKYHGLVISLLDANKARDKSHFEHFVPFHQAFYKHVEPLSVTPFTESTLDKMLTTLVVAFLRIKIPGMAAKNGAQYFEKEKLLAFRNMINTRFKDSPKILTLFEEKLVELTKEWENSIHTRKIKYYKKGKMQTGLLKSPSEISKSKDDIWVTMQSMREIDTSSFLEIQLPKVNRK